MHYLVLRLEDAAMATLMAESMIKNYMWLNDFSIGTGEDIYYNASNICEDTSEVTLVLRKETEDES